MKEILDSHRSLSILNEISKGEEMTQRDLSQRVGMAVGLVNTYLKHLVSKGYVKISGIPPKRFKYYLTPKGFLEKSKLTYKLIQNYTNVFQEARRDFLQLFMGLRASGVREVYFAGMDELAEIAYLSLKEADIGLAGAADDAKAGERFFGISVTPLAGLGSVEAPVIVLTTFNRRDEVRGGLAALGIDPALIHSIHPAP